MIFFKFVQTTYSNLYPRNYIGFLFTFAYPTTFFKISDNEKVPSSYCWFLL